MDMHSPLIPPSWHRAHHSDQTKPDKLRFKVGDEVQWPVGQKYYCGTIVGPVLQAHSNKDWLINLHDNLPPMEMAEADLTLIDPDDESEFRIGDKVEVAWGKSVQDGVIIAKADPERHRFADWVVDLDDGCSPVPVGEYKLTLLGPDFMPGDKVKWDHYFTLNSPPIQMKGELVQRSGVDKAQWLVRRIGVGNTAAAYPVNESALELLEEAGESPMGKRHGKRKHKEEKQQKSKGLQGKNPDLYGSALPGARSRGAYGFVGNQGGGGYKQNQWRSGWQRPTKTSVQDIATELFGGTYVTATNRKVEAPEDDDPGIAM